MSVRSYRDLLVWQRAMDVVCVSYEATRTYPHDERRGLVNQMRRAAVSIAANIAEGHARAHRKEFLQFLAIAHGSLVELETHLLIAQRVGYITADSSSVAAALCSQVSRMLTAMRTKLGDPSLAIARRSTLDA